MEEEPDAAPSPSEPDAAPPSGAPDAAPPPPGAGSLTIVRGGQGLGQVVSSPAGLTCGSGCTAQFPAGATVNLTATPDPTSRFVGWNGSCSGASTTCTVVVNGSMSVQAQFERLDVSLGVALAGDGAGSIVSVPAGAISCAGDCSETYPYGTNVVLGASAAGGSEFLGWSGACTGTGPCVVTMDGAKQVTASFRKLCTAAPTIIGTPGTTAFTVPAGCRAASVKAWGGAGGGVPATPFVGGGGGQAAGRFATTPGEVLQLVVGAGGTAAPNNFSGAGGGGSSTVARGTTPLLVAGGGGGAGSQGPGGGAGGPLGADGTGGTTTHGGKGGGASPGAGGTGYQAGPNGLAGTGANGGAGGTNGSTTGGGGAGGTGWGSGGTGGVYIGGYGGGAGGGGGGRFGGGGGGGSNVSWFLGAGGGGGSSHAEAGGSTSAASGATPGASGDPDYSPGVGLGSASSGGHGRLVIVWQTE
jgi:hypothetical protein